MLPVLRIIAILFPDVSFEHDLVGSTRFQWQDKIWSQPKFQNMLQSVNLRLVCQICRSIFVGTLSIDLGRFLLSFFVKFLSSIKTFGCPVNFFSASEAANDIIGVDRIRIRILLCLIHAQNPLQIFQLLRLIIVDPSRLLFLDGAW